MIKIVLANAGYGKTSRLVENVQKIYNPDKEQYAIAFTNNAVKIIKDRIRKENLTNLKCCTIHSFLYEEIIKKYSTEALNTTFYGISNEKLNNDPKFKNGKLKKINNQNLIHVTQIPKKAKMIIDRKPEVLETFKDWLEFVVIDEAQDLDSDMIKVFDTLTKYVDVYAVGDVKQDLKGSNSFNKYCNNITDIMIKNETYRLKENHVLLVNSYVNEDHQHVSKQLGGEINVYLEKDVKDIQAFIDSYDLAYISKSTGEYYTKKHFDKVYPQIKNLFERILNESRIEYDEYTLEEILEIFTFNMLKGTYVNIRDVIEECGLNNIGNNAKGQIVAEVLAILPQRKYEQKYKVDSIHSVKGAEAERCLFLVNNEMSETILNNDYAIKKMNNLLYVAMTRSTNILDFLILDSKVFRYTDVHEELLKYTTIR